MTAQTSIDAWLRTLADNDAPTSERRRALTDLGIARFSDVAFEGREAEYRAACRAATTRDNEDVPFRVEIIAGLCMEKDRDTQKRLMEGLEDPGREIAPPHKALKFLGYDPHAAVFPIARRYAEDPPYPRAQHEAVRLLGADPGSAEVLARILAGRDEDPESRYIACIELSSLDADRFVAVAKQVMVDREDGAFIRGSVLDALEGVRTSPEDLSLRAACEAVLEDETSTEAMRASARAIVQRTPGPLGDDAREDGQDP